MATKKKIDVTGIEERFMARVGEGGDPGFDNVGTEREPFDRMTQRDLVEEFDAPRNMRMSELEAWVKENYSEADIKKVAEAKRRFLDAHQKTKGARVEPRTEEGDQS